MRSKCVILITSKKIIKISIKVSKYVSKDRFLIVINHFIFLINTNRLRIIIKWKVNVSSLCVILCFQTSYDLKYNIKCLVLGILLRIRTFSNAYLTSFLTSELYSFGIIRCKGSFLCGKQFWIRLLKTM